jgi:hypothetical protein
MDQTMKGFGRPFGNPDVVGGGIDEPDTAEPSLRRDEREAADRGRTLDGRDVTPTKLGDDQDDGAVPG